MNSKAKRGVFVRRRLALAALATLGAAECVSAQSVWNANSGNWEAASNWTGGVPNAEGAMATIPDSTAPQTSFTITISTDITLSKLVMDTATSYTIARTSAGTGSIVIPASGLTLSVLKARSISPSFLPAPSVISAPLTGGPLIKDGAALITLSSTANSFSSLTVNEGLIRIAAGDGVLGTGNLFFNNGGGLRIITADWTSSRSITLGAGGGTIDNAGRTITLSGAVSGSSSLLRTGSGTTNFNGNMSGFTGTMTVQTTGTTSLGGTGGALTGVQGLDLSGTFILNNTATANSNRIADTAPIAIHGGEFRVTNSGSGVTVSEVVGAMTIDAGQTVITVSADSGAQGSLQLASLTRANGATGVVRGTGLGNADGAGVAAIKATSAPSGLVGADLGATSRKVVPWLAGASTATATTSGLGLVTYDTGTGALRPLTTAEYATSLSGVNENVLLTGANTVDTPTTVGGLVLSGATLSGAGSISVSTGAVVVTDGAATIGVPLNFGSAEAVFHMANNVASSKPIAGTGGLTKSGIGTWTFSGEASSSTYTGKTTLNAGAVVLGGNLPADGVTPSAFGLATSPIVLSGGNAAVRLTASAASVIDRPIQVTGGGSAEVLLGSNTAGGQITVNGAVQLDRELTIASSVGNPVVLNGAITGTGRLADNNDGGLIYVNGSNSFSGGVRMLSGTTWVVGHDNALGTGTVWLTGGTGSTISATGTRVIPNTISVINNSGSVSFAGDATANLTLSGTIDFGGPTADMFFNNVNPVTFSGKLTNGRLTKNGAGTLILTGNNSDYTGNFRVNQGILQIGADGPDGVLLGFPEIVAGAQLVFRRTGTLVLPGAPSGAGDRVIESGGTVVVTGTTSASNTGRWLVNNGTLQAGNGAGGGSLGSGEVAIAAGAALNYNRSGTVNIGTLISGAGEMIYSGPGLLRFNTDNTLSGPLTINGGTMAWGNNTTAGSFWSVSSLTLNSGGTLAINRSDNITFNRQMTGAGTFAQTGTGTTIIAGSYPTIGAVNVTGGRLQFGDGTVAGSLGSGLITTGAAGVVAFNLPAATTFSNNISGGGSVANDGPGAVTLTGSLTYTGNTTVNNSALTVYSSLRPVAGSLVVTGAGSVSLNAPGVADTNLVTGEFAAISVSATGSVKLAASDRTVAPQSVLVTGALDIQGTLDLTNNDMVVRNGSESSLRAAVAAWWNGGLRNGTTGLISSVGSTASGINELATLAVVTNSNGVGSPLMGGFDGVAVTTTDVLVKYTYLGDANLDGKVTTTDIEAVIRGIRGQLTGWVNGDTNYDNVVNGDDLANVLIAYRLQGLSFGDSNIAPSGGTGGGTGGGAVPEPTALGLLLAAVPMMRRRRV